MKRTDGWPIASVLWVTDVVRDALAETWLEQYSSHMALVDADMTSIRNVVSAFKLGAVKRHAARNLFNKAIESSHLAWEIPDVSLRDALEENAQWDALVEDFITNAHDSGFPEWTIYTSDPFPTHDIRDPGDPFALLARHLDIPPVTMVDAGPWLFILRSDQTFYGASSSVNHGRPEPYMDGKKLPLAELDLTSHEGEVLCYSIPSILESAVMEEVIREAKRQGVRPDEIIHDLLKGDVW